MGSFKDVTLLVHFNYSEHLKNNVPILKDLYEGQFKEVLFYSSLGKDEREEGFKDGVWFSDSWAGHVGYKSLIDLKLHRPDVLEDSDGIMFLMDDVLLNLNYLQTLDNSRIIYFKEKQFSVRKNLEEYTDEEFWRMWARDTGRKACYNSIADSKNIKFTDDDFVANISDCFYIPKNLITDELFTYLEIFSKNKVHLEIAIPSLLRRLYDDELLQEFSAQPHFGNFNRVNHEQGKLAFNNNLYIHRAKLSDPEMIKFIKDIL